MLNGIAGRISTGRGVLPAGASQRSNGVPSASSSSATSEGAAPPLASPARTGAALASTNSSRASASPTIERKLAGVTDAASGATTTPARSAPRKSAA